MVIDPSLGGNSGTNADVPVLNLAHLRSGIEDAAMPFAEAGFVTAGNYTQSVAVMFKVPDGVTVAGALYNPATDRWVASIDDVNQGKVTFKAASDFAGTFDMQVEAVATGSNLHKVSTGIQTMHVSVAPVADGVAISGSGAGSEDQLGAIPLNITLAAIDKNSGVVGGLADPVSGIVTPASPVAAETLTNAVYIKIDAASASYGATLSKGNLITTTGDPHIGYYQMTPADLATLHLIPGPNWNGDVTLTVAASSIDGSGTLMTEKESVSSFSVHVAAVADQPQLTVPSSPVHGTEDASIAITGLSADLADKVTVNGAEILSVKISGVPDGTKFNFGSNNGDGSWTIPADKLGVLEITPPLNYAGPMHLTLQGYAIESSNGDIATSSKTFDVVVDPVADDLKILAAAVSVDASGLGDLHLNLRLGDLTGTTPGEIGPELVHLTFTGVPAGMFLVPSSGGELTYGSGAWVFTGSQDQANALQIASGPGAVAGTAKIAIAAFSIDGSAHGTVFNDTFQLTVAAPTSPGATFAASAGQENADWHGHTGNDVLSGDAAGNTLIGGSGINRITGGGGSDTMTGGAGTNIYLWNAADDAGGAVDTITNFKLAPGKDLLDLSKLLTGFNQQTSVLDNFLHVKADGKTIQVDNTGSGLHFHDVVVLENTGVVDVHAMVKNGNLIV